MAKLYLPKSIREDKQIRDTFLQKQAESKDSIAFREQVKEMRKRNPRVLRKCKTCRQEFEVRFNHKNQLTCPKCIQAKQNKLRTCLYCSALLPKPFSKHDPYEMRYDYSKFCNSEHQQLYGAYGVKNNE